MNCKKCIHKDVCLFRNPEEDEKTCVNFKNESDVTSATSAKWLDKLDKLDSKGYIYYECSNCNAQHKHNTNFCPDCGAVMKKGE